MAIEVGGYVEPDPQWFPRPRNFKEIDLTKGGFYEVLGINRNGVLIENNSGRKVRYRDGWLRPVDTAEKPL